MGPDFDRASADNARAAAEPAADLLARANAVLDTIPDPELPFLTIRDLGILRDVRIVDGVVEIVITPTYSGCPAHDVIVLEIDGALAKAGIEQARLVTVRAPAWTTDWLTPAAHEKLKANGIAPPRSSAGKRALFAVEQVACPNCDSTSTERVSEFGSTPCKAHYRCLGCRDPFEAFKCI